MNNFFKKANITLYKGFLLLFLFSFILIFLNVIFNKTVYSYNTIFLILCMLFFFSILGLFIVIFRLKENFFIKYYYVIVVAAAVVLFCLQLIFGFRIRFEPIWDLEAIYKGAITWVEQGTFTGYSSDTCHTDYFYIFPNNLGSMAFLAGIFKISNTLGCYDYFAVATIINSIMLVLSMLFVQAISRYFFGKTGGIWSIILFLSCLPFYFISAVFYTDSLSILFPLVAFYALLKAESANKLSFKIIWYTLFAVMCLLGALIKMTVLIIVIAAIIYFLLKKKWREILLFVSISIIIISSGFATFNEYMYSNHLEKEKAESINMPILYWVDLALHGDGRYNNEIFWTARNFDSQEEKITYLKEDIKTAVEELELDGVLKLFEKKSARAFGDGTFALSDFLDDRPVNNGFLPELLLYNGKYYSLYSTVTTAVFLSLQMLMIISVFLEDNGFKLAIPKLSVFGIMLFLLFWEINSRYITTFVPFIIICAVGGICYLTNNLKKTVFYSKLIEKRLSY